MSTADSLQKGKNDVGSSLLSTADSLQKGKNDVESSLLSTAHKLQIGRNDPGPSLLSIKQTCRSFPGCVFIYIFQSFIISDIPVHFKIGFKYFCSSALFLLHIICKLLVCLMCTFLYLFNVYLFILRYFPQFFLEC